MTNPNKEAWDTLTEADFIHSCDCIVCKSLRDDSCRSCSGCAVHHVANKALRAKHRDVEGMAQIVQTVRYPQIDFDLKVARAVVAWLEEG